MCQFGSRNKRQAEFLCIVEREKTQLGWAMLEEGEREKKNLSHGIVDWKKKKKTQPESWELCLFGGLAEDLSPGGNLSDSSEGLVWRCKARNQDIEEVLLKQPGGGNIKKLLLIKEKQISQVNDFSVFLRKNARVWAHWNHSFDMHLNYLGSVSCFSPSWIPSGCTIGGSCSSWCLDSCNILCLLIRQVTYFHPQYIKADRNEISNICCRMYDYKLEAKVSHPRPFGHFRPF